MDPISLFFISYAELIQGITQKRILDVKGTDISSISVMHDGVDIPFSFQLWRIRDNSVCSKYSANAAQYSSCTVAARSLFNDMCGELQKVDSTELKQKRIKNMYCNAAVQFKPVVANVQWTEARSELDIARRECNTALAAASGSVDPELIARRDYSCQEYRELKAEINE